LHASFLLHASVACNYFIAAVRTTAIVSCKTCRCHSWDPAHLPGGQPAHLAGGCNTKILAEIFDEPASPCNNLQQLAI